MTSNWKQPEPTKAYAVYMDGAWYGEGDTKEGAWESVRRQVSAGHSREGDAMYAKIKRYGSARKVESVADPARERETQLEADRQFSRALFS